MWQNENKNSKNGPTPENGIKNVKSSSIKTKKPLFNAKSGKKIKVWFIGKKKMNKPSFFADNKLQVDQIKRKIVAILNMPFLNWKIKHF